MMTCSAIFCAGVVLEAVRSRSIAVFYTGRVVCGLGIGGSATVIPIYLGEMSPKESRARLGSCYQFTFTIGILVSYWVDYAVVKMVPDSDSSQWQIPIALQLVPGALMGLGMLTLPESVRWLLYNSTPNNHTSINTDLAWQSLTWIRASPNHTTQTEFHTMQSTIAAERQTRASFHASELLTHRPNLHRLALGFGIFLAQQSTGATAMAYFGPQFFAMLVGPGDKNLLLTGVFGGVKVIACFVFVVFVAERFGRRPLLIGGAVVMAGCMVVTASLVKAHPPPPPPVSAESGSEQGNDSIPGAAIATILLIYLNITAFNLSWGPLPWPCISEIFPTRIREPGVALGVASQWFFNFVWSFSTPYIMAGMGWATFLLFGVLDLLFAGFVWGFLTETKGLSLEEINELFESRKGGSGNVEEGVDQGKVSEEDEDERSSLRPNRVD